MDFKGSSLLYSPGLAFFCSSSCEGAWKRRLYLVCSVWPIFLVLSDAGRASLQLWTWNGEQPSTTFGVKMRHGVASKRAHEQRGVDAVQTELEFTPPSRLFKDLFCYKSMRLIPQQWNLVYNYWGYGSSYTKNPKGILKLRIKACCIYKKRTLC